MELVQQLRQDGIAKGLCKPWQMKLRDGVSIKRLIELYIRGIDFCIANDYPTLDFIRENFKGKCEDYGVHVDEDVRLMNDERLVIQGDCSGLVEFNDYTVSRVFVRNNSNVTVKVSGYAVVTIDMFDDSHITLEVAGTRARVNVALYGNSTISSLGKVKVVRKNKKTY